MFRHSPRRLALVVVLLGLTGRAAADGTLHPPAPVPAVPCPEIAIPCPAVGPGCPAPRIELVMAPPEVKVVRAGHAGGHGGVCQTGHVCKDCGKAKDCDDKECKSKGCSMFNLSITKIKGGGVGGRAPATETTVVPAFATATIPIAMQTTRTFTGEAAFVRRGVSREEIAAAVREAIAAEAEAQRESAGAKQNCADLCERLNRVEADLASIKESIKRIEAKLPK